MAKKAAKKDQHADKSFILTYDLNNEDPVEYFTTFKKAEDRAIELFQNARDYGDEVTEVYIAEIKSLKRVFPQEGVEIVVVK
jgi:hypothetical protein